MRRTTAAIIVAAFLTFTVALNARADVRDTAPWSAHVSATWPFEDASTLCHGMRPSDLEAWNTSGQRVGDDLLTYFASPMPGFLPAVIVSRYPFDVLVFGWCG